MFPRNAAFNGPGKSLVINQNREGLANSLVQLAEAINDLPSIANPDIITLPTPVLPSTLNISLPGGQFELEGTTVTIAPVTQNLPQAAEIIFSGAKIGTGQITDFTSTPGIPGTYLSYQNSGQYYGGYLTNSLTSCAPLAITDVPLSLNYQIQSISNSTFSFSMADANGNGFWYLISGNNIILYNSSTLSSQNLVTGSIFTGLNTPTSLTFLISTGLELGTYTLGLQVNGQTMFSTTTASIMNPSCTTTFQTSSGQLFVIYGWNWGYTDSTPVVGWQQLALPYGATTPPNGPHSRNFFQVSTSETAPIAIRPIYYNGLVSTQIAAARDTLNQLQAAYN